MSINEFIPVINGAQPVRPVRYTNMIPVQSSSQKINNPPTVPMVPTIMEPQTQTQSESKFSISTILIIIIIVGLFLTLCLVIYNQSKSPTGYNVPFILGIVVLIIFIFIGVYLVVMNMR